MPLAVGGRQKISYTKSQQVDVESHDTTYQTTRPRGRGTAPLDPRVGHAHRILHEVGGLVHRAVRVCENSHDQS